METKHDVTRQRWTLFAGGLWALSAGGCFSPGEPPEFEREQLEEPTLNEPPAVGDPQREPSDGGKGQIPGPNQDPRAHADGPYLALAGDTLSVGPEEGLLANDEDVETTALRTIADERITDRGGLARIGVDGSFEYEPPAGLPFGTDRFEYVVRDGHGARATGAVRVVVQAPEGVVSLDDLGVKGRRVFGTAEGDKAGQDVAGVGDVNGDGYDDVLVAWSRDGAGAALIYGQPAGSATSIDEVDVTFEGAEGTALEMAPAGDVNGDGYADLLIADWTFGGGVVWLVMGGAELPAQYELNQAPVRFVGIEAGDRAGISIAGAGDVDGDGFDDLLIGADQVGTELGPNVGEAYLFLDVADLAGEVSLASADVRLPGIAAGDQAGRSVAIVGDLDGDGFDDLAVGAHVADPGGRDKAGEVYVIRGGFALPPVLSLAEADLRFEGGATGDRAGISLAGVGDVNGDDRDDLLLGAYLSDPGGRVDAGEAYLVLGRPVLAGTIGPGDAEARFGGIDVGDRAGYRVSAAGDVDGDGHADLLIGAHQADPQGWTNAGEISLLLGRSEPSQMPDLPHADLRFVGSTEYDRAGISIAAAGDVDGDGFDDVVLSADRADPGEVNNAGEALVVLGDDLRGRVTALGTGGDDTLQAAGGPASDALVGGRGDDRLLGDGGIDVLRAGAGDDRLYVADDRFFRIRGGHGDDTLELAGGMDLDLSPSADARVQGIERIELATDGASSLTLSEVRVRRMSASTHTLTIEGDEDDDVVLVSGAWAGPTPEGGHAVYVSTQSHAVLRIAPAVTVTLP